MHFITREEARQNIVALGPPQIVLDIFDEKPLPYNLDITFRFPYPVFCLDPDGQAKYGQSRITPIWTGGGDYTIVAYHHDPNRLGFFRFDVEDGEEEHPIGMNWQQVLVKEFKFLWETELSDEKLKEISELFGFNFIERMIDELRHAKLDTFERDAAWYHSFLERIEE